MRFDEIELEAVPLADEVLPVAAAPLLAMAGEAAPRGRRALALFIDLSLFVALTLALLPLLPAAMEGWPVLALAGFVVVMSYYYFVGTWLLWGKTIGGAIFDVKVVPADDEAMSLQAASARWGATYLSLLTCGLGFLMAALPSRRSLCDRLSATKCVTG